MEKVMNEKIIMNYEVVELLHKSSSWGNIVFKVKPQNKEKLYVLKCFPKIENGLQKLIFKREIEALRTLNVCEGIVKLRDSSTELYPFKENECYGGIVKLNNGEIPKGITKDYPKFKVRSFSLDVARKPASLESLEDFVDAMAYYKMNDFQVHLNDNLIFYENFESAEVARERAYTGFRLESDIKAGGENKKDLTNEDLFYTK